MLTKPIDNGNGAVIHVIHHDGRSTVNVIGPFDSISDAEYHAERMSIPNRRLRLANMVKP